MGIVNNVLAGASGNQGYFIQRSLRFRSSASAYLSRTPASAGNFYKWTVSFWLKKTQNSVSTGADLIVAENGPTSNTEIRFNSSDQIGWYYTALSTALLTNQVFRDNSSWYHFVFVFDSQNATASNRAKIYVNGSEVTSFATDNRASMSGAVSGWNNAVLHYLMQGNGAFVDGYIAEFNNIDGQALTPSSFGQTDAVTGVWTPKKYTGTYGTNGFYLPFSDNTSATTLAYDKSGNGNNWTANNISTTAGATYDSMTDVPTLTSATAANFAVWNPLDRTAATYSEGNLKVVSSSAAAPYNMTASIAFPTTGKFYCEVTALVGGSSPLIGLGTNRPSDLISGYRVNGTYINNIAGASTSGTPSAYTTNDIIGIAYDIDAGTLSFYKNGVAQSGGISGIPANGYFLCVRADSASGDGGYLNCGQRPFSYTPPTGFKSLNTFNLPDPVIKKPNQYMDVKLDTGANIKGTAESTFTGDDLIWIKDRANANNHQLIDTVRGSTAVLQSNTTAAETTYSTPSGNSVAWCWKESATSGFDIVTFTSPASGNFTVNHSLGVTPAMVIVKTRDTAGWNWHVWHKSLSSATNSVLVLNGTNAVNSSFNMWGASGATSTNIGITTGNPVPANSSCVAYLFAEIAGFSKFGSYTGNGSADGVFVYLGFRPKLIMWKNTSVASDWVIYDTSRSVNNVCSGALFPDTSGAEASNGDYGTFCDILSNGFKNRSASTAGNNSGNTIIYAAFAENPFKYSLAR